VFEDEADAVHRPVLHVVTELQVSLLLCVKCDEAVAQHRRTRAFGDLGELVAFATARAFGRGLHTGRTEVHEHITGRPLPLQQQGRMAGRVDWENIPAAHPHARPRSTAFARGYTHNGAWKAKQG
jgi:hypothetical protein